jgi:hypothetical protein
MLGVDVASIPITLCVMVKGYWYDRVKSIVSRLTAKVRIRARTSSTDGLFAPEYQSSLLASS